MPKYSIVTPVYNSFDLMEPYFKSLEDQTFKDFEVIIIDDSSTDGSYERLVKYAHISSLDIHLMKTENNSGPGHARNIGIDLSKGEWITFIDNDDWIATDLLKRIDDVITANDVHCVIYDYFIQKKGQRAFARSMYRGETGRVPVSDCVAFARNHTFGKFYKRSDCMEANIYFPNLRRCEDIAFTARAIDACGSVYYLNEPMYYYRQRNSSLSNNISLDESDLLCAFRVLENNLEEKYSLELREKSVPDLLYSVLLIMCKTGRSRQEITAYIKRYAVKYPNWEKCKIMKYLGKGKFFFLQAARYKAIGVLKMIAYVHTKMIASGGGT